MVVRVGGLWDGVPAVVVLRGGRRRVRLRQWHRRRRLGPQRSLRRWRWRQQWWWLLLLLLLLLLQLLLLLLLPLLLLLAAAVTDQSRQVRRWR